MAGLSVELSGVQLKNPVIPASGTFGFGYEFAEWYDLNLLGAICCKGTTEEPRFGNPTPRIAECESGMLNAVGLQNPGVEAVIGQELPRLRAVYQGPVIANVSGFSAEEYARCCAKLAPHVDMLEVNVSCPNVHAGGRNFGTDPAAAAAVTRAVRAATDKPVYLKLTPNVTDIAAVARACADEGADGFSLINTLLGLRIDVRRRRPVLANGMGGLSGPAILPVAVRMIWQVYEAVKLPIIGLGGVRSARDVVELMLAGATAVQVGAANLVEPCACRDIIAGLPAELDALGVRDIRELTGGAHHG